MIPLLQFPFFTSLVICFLSLLGIYFGHNYWAIVLILVIHPLFDTWIGPKKWIMQQKQSPYFDQFLLLSVFTVYIIWFYCLYFFMAAQAFSSAMVIAVACGIMMGFLGLTTAHELVHRPEGRLRWSGFLTLWILNYGHWGIEHVFGHHKNVATTADPVSARKNETLYVYLVRAIGGSFIHSFNFEKQKPFFKNKVKLSLFIQIIINLLVFGLFGFKGLIFHWTQSLVAIILLESVEYIEHYGLVRKKMDNGLYEPVTDQHSWDCDYYLTNAALINLGYHSHHHQKPLVAYQDLPNKLGIRLLPFGYSLMIVIALFPPVFFRMMNPHIENRSVKNL